jgi:hypothetical protein
MTKKQFERLPKYAQDAINASRREIDDLKKEIALLRANYTGDTNTFVWHGLEENIPLPNNARIHFKLDEGRYRYIECQVKNGKLHVHGSDMLNIQPEVTNVIDISLRGVLS